MSDALYGLQPDEPEQYGVNLGSMATRGERGTRVAVESRDEIGVLVAAPSILLASSIDWLPLAIAGLICFGLAKAFSDSNMMPILCTVTDARRWNGPRGRKGLPWPSRRRPQATGASS